LLGSVFNRERRAFLGEIVADILDALYEHVSQIFIHKAANPPVPFVVLAEQTSLFRA
jgi:hypothetical protein